MNLILASASPRRRELLQAAGIPFTAQPTDIPEIPVDREAPRAFAERLAREKAQAIAHRHPHEAVLGADTVVVVDGLILGKPEDAADALRMLRLLSGKTHEVITAVCVIAPSPTRASSPETATGNRQLPTEHQLATGNRQPATALPDVRSETTQVTFAPLSDADIESYISTGEPMDKAGAYGIQGVASRWIPRIVGDYSNVVGLPVALVYRMLKEHGLL
jgi:septum formation protein